MYTICAIHLPLFFRFRDLDKTKLRDLPENRNKKYFYFFININRKQWICK